MLELTAPRVHQVISHYCRRLGLDDATSHACRCHLRACARGTATDPRGARASISARAGITAKGVPLAMLTIFAELEGVICSGPRRGKEFTYAQLAARAP